MIKSSDYKLPICDVDSERRNFPGYQEAELKIPEMRQQDNEGHTMTSRLSELGATKLYKQNFGKSKTQGGRTKSSARSAY